jgi:hypothetical protein
MNLVNFDIGLLVALDVLLTEKSVTRAGDQHNPLAPAEVLWERIVGSRGAQNGLNPVG